jgi:hypothetical protein
MRLLRLVGPGEDGTSVVLEAVDTDDAEGERFELAVDDRLRSLAAGEPASPATQVEPPSETSGPVPTPREIQVRVRAGETAEAVAAEAGIPLERVMRFAYPVLQERVRVTDEARRARARRGGDGLLVPFGELIDSRFTRHGVEPAAVRWDAYRREDGGWTVTAEFSSYQRTVRAKFSFALLNRTVSALDDIAADLLSDRPVQALLPPPPPPAPEPVAEAPGQDPEAEWDAGTPPPRLTAVPNPARAAAGRSHEASPAVRPPSRRQKAHTRPIPVDADDELFDQNAFEQQPWHEPQLPFEAGATVPESTPAGTDDLEPAEPEILGLRFEPASYLPGEDEPEQPGTEAGAADGPPVDADSGDPQADATVTAGSGPSDSPNRRARRSGEKPRMPSWDDILLGVRHKTD